MAAYYNEIDPYAAQWLRNLIGAGLIADGEVDERTIIDVRPDDLRAFTQCHFFAGIAGWSYALRLAGWPDDRPVWTGSCPCQPFSTAGKKKGKTDERHLWPVWFHLIRECRPDIIFGEQVASAIAAGWADEVCDDLEGEGYACGSSVLPALCIGSPTKRDRLFFVAYSKGEGEQRKIRDICEKDSRQRKPLFQQSFSRIETSWRETDRGTKLFPNVVNGFPRRMGNVCAYGNAIVPQVASAFISTFMEYQP